MGLPHGLTPQQQEQFKRILLRLYIDRIQQTGECDYPELVRLAKQTYRIASAEPHRYLMPDRIEELTQQLEAVRSQIQIGASKVAFQVWRLGEKELVEAETTIASNLQAAMSQMGEAIETVLDLARKYGDVPDNADRSNGGLDPTELAKRERIRKTYQDIGYIRQYLQHHAQTQRIRQELQLTADRALYLRRLFDYLSILPDRADELVDLLRHSIGDRNIDRALGD